MNSIPQVTIDLFWGKVDKDNSTIFYNGTRCWEWTGAKNKSGYGHCWIKDLKTNRKSHRVSWVIHYGKIPDNLLVCHHCDNPPCINPLHLFAGTSKDNALDRNSKNRGRKPGIRKRPETIQYGERSPNHKLTSKQVAEIRRLYKPSVRGSGCLVLAHKYGVSKSTIFAVVRGKNWKASSLP